MLLRAVALLILLIAAACGPQPHPGMWGGDRTDIRRDGRQYTIWQKGDRVEVIRLGWANPGEHQAIRATMIALIPEVTGCRLNERSLQGDSGEMRAKLRCPD